MVQSQLIAYAETMRDVAAMAENLLANGVTEFHAELLRPNNLYKVTWTPPETPKEGEEP